MILFKDLIVGRAARQVGSRAVHFNLAVGLAMLTGLAAAFAQSPAAETKPVKIVAFGDSLTAGFMLQPSESFPAQLEKALKAKDRNVRIENAGVSGDTTSDGLERFDWSIPDGTDAVILEFGANDALRGASAKRARANLEKIVIKLKERNIDVLLAGMAAPKNWGEDYPKAFDTIYPDLAKKYDLILYPFFLDGVAMDAKLNLNDGMHPNAKGIAVIVERILPKVEELIGRAEARRTAASKS